MKDPQTWTREQVDAVMLRRMQELVQHAYTNAPFYRERLDAAGVSPDQIKTLDDVRRLPVTTRRDFAQSQSEQPPLGKHVTVGLSDVVRICIGTGVNGAVVEPFTRQDIQFLNELMACSLQFLGVRSDDVAVVTSNYSYVPSGLLYQGGLEFLGCATIPVGVGDSQRLVRTLKDLPVTVLNAFTSYCLRIAENALELGVDPAREFSLKRVLIGGEPGGGLPEVRARLRQMYGAHVEIREFYGTAENGRIGVECGQGHGYHLMEPYQYIEIVDPQTYEPVAPGVPGVILSTTLGRYGWPVIRFCTDDLCYEIDEPCSCGWPQRRISPLLGKTGGIARVKGILVYPEPVAAVISRFSEFGRFQMIVTRDGTQDVLTLEAEADDNLDPAVRGRLLDELKSTLAITPVLDLKPRGSLPEEVKFRRMVDRREVYFSGDRK